MKRKPQCAAIFDPSPGVFSEHLEAGETDRRGDLVAITLELIESLITVLIEIHRHAPANVEEIVERNIISRNSGNEFTQDRMLVLPLIQMGDRVHPGFEEASFLHGVAGRVGNIVNSPAIAVNRR